MGRPGNKGEGSALVTASALRRPDLTCSIAAPAAAGTITVTIPRLTVAEYHRPYVAIWLEPQGGGAARTLAPKLTYFFTKSGASGFEGRVPRTNMTA